MAGRLVALAVAVATVVPVGGASASTAATALDASKLTLQASDFPGSHAVGSRIPADGPMVGGYMRVIKLAKPYGASHYIAVISMAWITTDTANGATFYHVIGHEFSLKSERLKLVKQFLGGAGIKGKTTSVKLIKPRALGVHDSSMEIGFVVTVGKRRVNMSVSLLRVDRVIDADIAVGTGRTVARRDSLALTKFAAAHIAANLAPAVASPPSIGGTAAQGQTLTAGNGAWLNGATAFAYQWQRCDAGGASCAAVPGATGATYAVTSADATATLRVVVTAKNRFGSTSATSAQTAVVA